MATTKRFRGVVGSGPRGNLDIRVPFDPSTIWGKREVHHVAGTVDGHRWRGKLLPDGDSLVLRLGPAWLRDCSVKLGSKVAVVLSPEGPQTDELGDDVAAAFKKSPKARAFFESLPQFYRKGYTRWIDSAKKPETRAKRIRETLSLLEAGKRER